jgi:hypothetical protein
VVEGATAGELQLGQDRMLISAAVLRWRDVT